jgi:hypothetical protein
MHILFVSVIFLSQFKQKMQTSTFASIFRIKAQQQDLWPGQQLQVCGFIHCSYENLSIALCMIYTHPTIESIFLKYKSILGKDYTKYRNHVYRVFLNCMLIDPTKSNEEKYAVAAVFHDIGIWTNNTLDYLNPSIEHATKYLVENNKQHSINEIAQMIYAHHKTGVYKGEHATVENFRKADYMDVTLALFTYGFDKKKIIENRKKFPNCGFHFFLVKNITKNFFRHPLHPLPMFTR